MGICSALCLAVDVVAVNRIFTEIKPRRTTKLIKLKAIGCRSRPGLWIIAWHGLKEKKKGSEVSNAGLPATDSSLQNRTRTFSLDCFIYKVYSILFESDLRPL